MADMGKMMGLLQNLNYPCTKQDIMDKVQEQGSDDEMMGMVEKLPDREFSDMDDLKNEMTSMM